MSRVEKAIESGKCVVAVGGPRCCANPEVMFALRARQGLQPMALSGPAVAHVAQTVTADALGPALSNAGGIVVLVEPESADAAGVKAIGEILQRSRQKPELVIVARAYNPFAFGSALGGLRVQHEKNKGKPFLQALPEVAPAVAPAPVDGAPLGEEAEAVGSGRDRRAPVLLRGSGRGGGRPRRRCSAPGGPIVVHGPTGRRPHPGGRSTRSRRQGCSACRTCGSAGAWATTRSPRGSPRSARSSATPACTTCSPAATPRWT
jgi:hypothetical protein